MQDPSPTPQVETRCPWVGPYPVRGGHGGEQGLPKLLGGTPPVCAEAPMNVGANHGPCTGTSSRAKSPNQSSEPLPGPCPGRGWHSVGTRAAQGVSSRGGSRARGTESHRDWEPSEPGIEYPEHRACLAGSREQRAGTSARRLIPEQVHLGTRPWGCGAGSGHRCRGPEAKSGGHP